MKVILFFLIFSGVFCQAQNETVNEIEAKSDTLRKIVQPPIFPGCEKFKNVNENLSSCITNKLSFLVGNKFEELSLFKKYDKKLLKSKDGLLAKIEYKVTENGKLEVVRILQGGDEELAKDIVQIMTGIFENLIIEPAKLSDGTSVEKKMQLPVLIKR